MIYPSTLPNVACRKPIIPPIFVPLIRNVVEQNPIGFPNLMYLHVGPYTPKFGFGYQGIRSLPTMWPPMFNPLTNLTAPPKLILKITQARIVTNHRELLDEDEDYSKRKHNSKMPWIVPLEKLYHERRGRPSLVGNASRSLINGWVVPINNGDGGPFDRGRNGPLRGNPLKVVVMVF